ncbi:MAG: hypothetical protein E7417_06505 [Ruminococcaceae bacterium]|nr:hypothetical protein [Oscillospiraceae bacterium]
MKKDLLYNLASGVMGYIKKEDTGKIVYPVVYKKVREYIAINHNNARCSDILKTESGWSCIIMEDDKKTALYISKTENGKFSFWEKEI